MRAERIKQVLKNSVYRTIGETAAVVGANGNGHRTLRVLMYHKVNDLPGNPLTMPASWALVAKGVVDGDQGYVMSRPAPASAAVSVWRPSGCSSSATRSSISTPCSRTTSTARRYRPVPF